MDKQHYATKTHATTNGVGDGATTNTNCGPTAVPEVSPASPCGLNHSRCHWTPHERSIMNKLFTINASPNLLKRYAKIVLKLQEKKTLNDVALRYRWMTEKRNSKQRTDVDSSLKRHKEINKKPAYQQVKPSANAHLSTSMDGKECINNDEISYEANVGAALSQLPERNVQAMNHIFANGSPLKEKAAYRQVKPSSHATNHSNGLHHAHLSTSIDTYEDIDDNVSYKVIVGPVGQLLEQNEQAMNQFPENKLALKVHRYKNLICQMTNNMDALVNVSLTDVPEMNQSARQRYDFSIMRRLKIG